MLSRYAILVYSHLSRKLNRLQMKYMYVVAGGEGKRWHKDYYTPPKKYEHWIFVLNTL